MKEREGDSRTCVLRQRGEIEALNCISKQFFFVCDCRRAREWRQRERDRQQNVYVVTAGEIEGLNCNSILFDCL